MKISVITTTWNSASTISDTIESVLRQTYSDFEHIIVDGGSTDGTLEIIKSYEPKYDGRLRYISEKDNGIYDAMNKGIRMATGDVVGILNSDDFYRDKYVLKDIADGIGGHDAVYGDLIYVDDKDTTKDVRKYSSKGFKLWKFKLGLMPAHPSFYCLRKVYDECGLYVTDLPIAADFDFIIRSMYLHGINAKYICRDFISMRVGGVSSSGFKSYIQSIKDRKKVFRRNGLSTNYALLTVGYLIKIGQLLKFKIKVK